MISCANAMGLAVPKATARVSLGFPVMEVVRKRKSTEWGSLNTSSKRCVSALSLWVKITQKDFPLMGERLEEGGNYEKKSTGVNLHFFFSPLGYWVRMNFQCPSGEFYLNAAANSTSCTEQKYLYLKCILLFVVSSLLILWCIKAADCKWK